ncbi:intracellular growth attenuator family protein [Xenorhabdus sp. 42]|uniref:Intracellular growth attenuator family protein n=1 Tax=Xenorhabdus szentirmaii TaxID=290112 RepID=A0AAW3YY11_9GAMM|nr:MULTISPECIES: IgaA/UmoB family intracellular growth attenuator [unclassified Xenorhabdus]MBD2781806.1 intracellular growth attenuator family protein [Xenorhabdus sp. 38]MBD2793272.1 intracellular growth attenuator family protein [Xenorhabdus sp. CUL]MBD2802436.1 intracellular growth attenuator family protein [Xenorhabdus sp. M]MBD2804810.1 intracellular growth attenuator family protein [Xenorhabdus sp. ZM]MBD2820565.1 intracellular growth attenuator family protein [Xenorhabdus sp. 42]
MSSLVIILAIFVISLIIMASFLTFRWRQLNNARHLPLPSVAKTDHHKLSADEHQLIESYLRNIHPQMKQHRDNRADHPRLSVHNMDVYTINHTITRFSAVSDNSHHWRYYIDETEVHLPAQLESFIKQKNTIDIIQTTSMPLVIGVNGYFLTDYQQDLLVPQAVTKIAQASIQKNGNSNANLLYVRKETVEERHLRYSTDIQESLFMCIGLALWFIALFVPIPMLPWLMLVSLLFILGSFWLQFRLPSRRKLLNIHCFNGIPKRWGIFSEFEPERLKNISLGGIDLIYPIHWEPYIMHDIDQTTDIDMYINGQVVRQGRHLSLHEEEKHYPYRRYKKNLILVTFSLLVMLVLYCFPPVSLSMRLSFAWLYGSDTKVITSVSELKNMSLKEGDVLKVKGEGMCYEPPNGMEDNMMIFQPFNCIGVYWNNELPLPVIESEAIEHISAFLTTIAEQLHPFESRERFRLNAHAAIVKPSLILLEDFPKIVVQAQNMCHDSVDCIRLKNVLLNLGNVSDWDFLLQEARSGKLREGRVLLRSGSADELEKIVEETTAIFFNKELYDAANLINSPAPGGVLLFSAEHMPLTEFPMVPDSSRYEYTLMEQWNELKDIVEMLMHTPFDIEGIVTELFEDANGTLNIMLHSEPDSVALIRYLGSCLLLALLLATLTINTALVISKKRKNQGRLQHITQHYDNCFKSHAPPMS